MLLSYMSQLREVLDLGLEGALTLFLLVCSFKVYKMKCDIASKCFKGDGDNGLGIVTHNSGGEEPV